MIKALRRSKQPSSRPCSSLEDAEWWTEERLSRVFSQMYPVPAELKARVWRRIQLRRSRL